MRLRLWPPLFPPPRLNQCFRWPMTNLVAICSNKWENYAIVIRDTICNICNGDIETSGKKKSSVWYFVCMGPFTLLFKITWWTVSRQSCCFFCVPYQSLGSRTIYSYTQCLIVLQTAVVVVIKLVKHFVHKCYLPLKMYVANYHNDTLWPVYIVMFVYCGSAAFALSLTFEVSI